MGKKRSREEGKDAPPADVGVDKMDEDSSDDEDFDIVNVDFEWFNFDPEIDFLGTKTLLRQLFDVDAIQFNMSALVDLILSQPTIGSTVKIDGKETDPYALLTVLNTVEHGENEAIKDLLQYIVEKAQANPSLAPIAEVLNAKKQVGLVLSERMINMPSEIVPPLYKMLEEEVEAAVEDKEPYEFSHYLLISRAYEEVESTLDVEDRKRKKAREEASLYHFHLEDEIFQKHAVAYGKYSFTREDNVVSDSKRAFQELGIKTFGHMILIEASQFGPAIQAVGDYIAAPQ